LGVLMAIVVRPRLWKALRKPHDLGAAITRDKAPQLFALLESSAAQINAPVPDYVYLDGQFNASTYRIGFKRETVLTIGLPLWESLSEQERVALLGHELAHQVNGDVTRGILVGCARRSLVEWLRMLNPRQSGHERWMARRLQRNSGPAYALALVLTPLVTIAVFGPPFLLALGCYAILNRFDLTNSKRAEYLADELGARLGSSAAALGLMERIALYESVRYFISREKSARFTGDLWPALRQYLDSIPDHEKRRRVRLDELHGTSVDSGHPANYLRHRLLAARPQQAGAIRPGTVDWSAIDAELTPYSRALARRLLGQRQGTTTRTGQSGAAAQSSPSS
ncbi:MAG: M48 family metalloprotease, partial [Actinocrinis sp.]